MQMKTYKTLIIGAGPSGLALGLNLEGDFLILEASHKAGGIYTHIDPNYRLVSPKSMCLLPNTIDTFNEEQIQFAEYAKYLSNIATSLADKIRYNENVVEVTKKENLFEIKTKTHCYLAKNLVLATGKLQSLQPLNIEHPKAISFHVFRKDQVKNKNILIYGSGLSAYETAQLASEHNTVTVAFKHKLKTIPMSVFGLNLHWPYRPIEKLPRVFFPCKGEFRDPVVNTGFQKLIKHGVIKTLYSKDADPRNYDLIINATGYKQDYDFVKFNLEKWPNGKITTEKNETSVKNLYLMGAHCARNFDSKFLRGIATDALSLAKRLNHS